MSRRSIASLALSCTLLTLTIPCHASTDEPFILISDVDDTVKITNVLDYDSAIWNTARSNLVFAGMPELYKQMLGSHSPAERLRFISAGFFTSRTNDVLRRAGFPAHQLTLHEFRSIRDIDALASSIYDFKTLQLQRLYGASRHKFILISDDTQSDPDVYMEFAKKHKDQVLAVYIHRITGITLPAACNVGETLPAGCISFVTAYDIALHEFVAGRMSEIGAHAVGEIVLNATARTFLPGFQNCPSPMTTILTQSESLASLQAEINDRLQKRCVERRTGAAQNGTPDLHGASYLGHSSGRILSRLTSRRSRQAAAIVARG